MLALPSVGSACDAKRPEVAAIVCGANRCDRSRVSRGLRERLKLRGYRNRLRLSLPVDGQDDRVPDATSRREGSVGHGNRAAANAVRKGRRGAGTIQDQVKGDGARGRQQRGGPSKKLAASAREVASRRATCLSRVAELRRTNATR